MRTTSSTGGPSRLDARASAILWACAVLAAAGGGCSDADGPHVGAADAKGEGLDGESCERRIHASIVEHACLHAVYGPHEELTARQEPPFSDVDEPHVAYHLALSSTTAQGFVSFRADREGDYVFFHSEVDALSVLSSTGDALSPSHRQHTASACTLLPHAQVFQLDTAQAIVVALGPGITALDLVIERLGLDSTEAWEVVCGSGSASDGGQDAGSVGPDVDAADGGDHSDGADHQGPLDAGVIEAGSIDASGGEPVEDAGPGDAEAVDSGDHGNCVGHELGARCDQDAECCSGRCYARRCVAAECRTEGPCTSHDECCLFCHFDDPPHCH